MFFGYIVFKFGSVLKLLWGFLKIQMFRLCFRVIELDILRVGLGYQDFVKRVLGDFGLVTDQDLRIINLVQFLGRRLERFSNLGDISIRGFQGQIIDFVLFKAVFCLLYCFVILVWREQDLLYRNKLWKKFNFKLRI